MYLVEIKFAPLIAVVPKVNDSFKVMSKGSLSRFICLFVFKLNSYSLSSVGTTCFSTVAQSALSRKSDNTQAYCISERF